MAAVAAGLTVSLALAPRWAFSSRPATQGGSLLSLVRRSCSTAVLGQRGELLAGGCCRTYVALPRSGERLVTLVAVLRLALTL